MAMMWNRQWMHYAFPRHCGALSALGCPNVGKRHGMHSPRSFSACLWNNEPPKLDPVPSSAMAAMVIPRLMNQVDSPIFPHEISKKSHEIPWNPWCFMAFSSTIQAFFITRSDVQERHERAAFAEYKEMRELSATLLGRWRWWSGVIQRFFRKAQNARMDQMWKTYKNIIWDLWWILMNYDCRGKLEQLYSEFLRMLRCC